MRNPLDRYRSWNQKRDQKFLLQWHRERLKGEGRFIMRTAIAWASMMLLVSTVWDDYYGKFDLILTVFRTVFYMLGGLFVGWFSWRAGERKYQQELQKRSSTLLSNKAAQAPTSPHMP